MPFSHVKAAQAERRYWRRMTLVGLALAAAVSVVAGLMLGWLPGLLSGLALVLGGVAYHVQQRWLNSSYGGDEAQHLRVQNLVENIFPSVLEIRDDEIVYAAPGQERLTGYQPAEMVGRSYRAYIHPGDLALANDWLTTGMQEGGLEIRVRHKQGHWVWTRNYAVARSEIGDKRGFTIAAYDAADERKARESLIQARRLEGLSIMAGGIAHDFNNLLTVIAGFAEILEQSEPRDNILHAADSAAVLVQRLMAFGPNNATDTDSADAGELAQSMRPVLARTLGPAITLSVQAQQDAWVPLCASQLSQALLNLVTNCKEALPDGGSVWVEVFSPASDPQWVHLVVRDDGPGMDANTVENAFDPFFSTKAKMAGSGLGLASVRGLVQQVGGRVRLTSTLGQGTAVILEMPRVAGRAPAATSPEPVAVLRGSGNVLVVEDDGLVADLVARSLLKAGYSVTIKNDVETAWQQLQAGLPDLLVTDIMMPDGRGTELARRLRQAELEVPILFISGYSDSELDEWQDNEGMVRFLAKPFRRQDLLDRVAHLVHRRSMVS